MVEESSGKFANHVSELQNCDIRQWSTWCIETTKRLFK